MIVSKELAFSRRDFIQLTAGAFVLAGIPILKSQRRLLIKHSLPVMGTTAELAVVHHDDGFARAALEAAARELLRIEQLMTRFNHASDVGRVNAVAGLERADVSPDTAFVLRNALEWASATDGAFDPAIARVVDLWDVKHRQTPPPVTSVKRLANRDLYRRIDLVEDRRGASVMIMEPDAAIDLGGIAAGYAVDRAVAVLREHGVEHGYVNVSGDIYVLGLSQREEKWRIGIRSPADPDALIGEVELSDAAVATSGDYEQGFTYGGRRYHHIMDPDTAEPRVTPVHSLTVTANTCIEADAATTALFGWRLLPAQRVLSVRAPGARIVDTPSTQGGAV